MFRHSEIQAILRKRQLRRENGELSEESEAESDPQDAATPKLGTTEQMQPGPATNPKTQQWATSSERTKKRNKRNRDKYKIKKLNLKLQRARTQKDGPPRRDEDSESDEWDPWHQANGPDVQKDEALHLDY